MSDAEQKTPAPGPLQRLIASLLGLLQSHLGVFGIELEEARDRLARTLLLLIVGAGSILLFLSIIASKTSFKFGVPALLLFLVVGMLAGSEGPGGIYFDDPKTSQFLGVIALTFILFSGGLETKLESISPVLLNGFALSTAGVFITAISVGAFTAYLLDFKLVEGMLLGAIVSSTDAAAVFSILRTRNIGLKGNLRPLLEF